MKRSLYCILRTVIILVGLYTANWHQLDPTVLAGVLEPSFHNHLHTFNSHPSITKHAKQMGYDYTTTLDAHSYGLKRIQSLNAQYSWLVVRDGMYHPENGMSASMKAEYDQYVCIRNAGQNDPALRYYLQWINPGAPCYDDASCAAGPSQVQFYTNFQSEAAQTAALNYLETHLDWTNTDAGFLDQVEIPRGAWSLAPSYLFGTRQANVSLSGCANVAPDYTFTDGYLRYRAALRNLFYSHGVPVSANPADIASTGQEVHATTPFDHYYNEWGLHQSAASFGIVPPGVVSLEVPIPPRSYNQNFWTTLGVSGLAAVQGSWFGTYGEDHEWLFTLTSGGDVITPGMNAIQLLRAMPNWDNLVGATSRSWNGSVYASSNSYADANVVYSRHPKTGKFFVVFRLGTGVLPLRPSERVVSVQCVDDLFIERGRCDDHFTVNGSEVRLTGSGQLNAGYIVEVR